jgi:bis(5'-nucleosyl)-tetraphosphatase (symmetrical)
MSTYAIGDLQGCYEELQELLLSFKFNEDRDCLWFCGDLVNRGPESLKCLNYLHSIKDNCKIVLGNHDIHLLAVVEGKRKLSESDTFIDVLESSNLSTLKNWMMTLPFHYIEGIKTEGKKKEYIMTHAGVPPTWTKADLENNSNELSSKLLNQNSNSFLEEIFGNYPNHPKKCKNNTDQLRLNLNCLTRMRYYDITGSLNLEFKGTIEEAPKNLTPWFEHELKIVNDHTHVLFGHWAALNGFTNKKNITALDTGCAWGNKLTAMRLEDNEFFSCDKLN